MLLLTENDEFVSPNSYQIDLLSKLESNYKLEIGPMPRRIGTTTLIANYIANLYIDHMFVNRQFKVLLVSGGSVTVMEIHMLKLTIERILRFKLGNFSKCKIIYNYLNRNLIRTGSSFNGTSSIAGIYSDFIYTGLDNNAHALHFLNKGGRIIEEIR